MEEASFGEGGYLVMVAQVGVEDEPEIAGGGGGVCVGSWGERESEDAVSLASCCGLPMIRKSVLEEFRARRFAAIQLEIEEKVD